jgi:hypothetical protein
MMRNLSRLPACRRPRTSVGLLAVLTAALLACDSESVFEGPPVVAPPVTAFDREAMPATVIHGGALNVSVTATDNYVGVDSVMVRYSGALAGSFTRRYAGAPAHVRVDTALAVPFGMEGAVLVEAFAANRHSTVMQVDSFVAVIVRQDTIRPTSVTMQLDIPAHVGLTDTISVAVTAQDDPHGTGIARVGVIMRDDAAPGAQPVTFVQNVPAVAMSVTHVLRIPVAQLPGPATLRVRNLTFVGFAVDQAGNCVAAGAAGTLVPCTIAAGQATAPDVAGAPASTMVIDMRTFWQAAPRADQIGDLVVDVPRRLLYISNQANNSVDAISWATPVLARTGRALVGALPRGMTIENGGQRLIVANSGGTSLSYVRLGGSFEEERPRYETPNAALWEIAGDAEVASYTQFNDRPQFVGQDSHGSIFYSTPGAVRWVETAPGWARPESGIMLWPQVVNNTWSSTRNRDPCYNSAGVDILPCVIAGIDSLKVVDYEQSPFLGTAWQVWAHPVGHPDSPFKVTSNNLRDIEQKLQNGGARPFMYHGSWDYSYWQTGATMFVTSSGDRNWINFADAEAGRVWNWGVIPGPSDIGGSGPRLYDRKISQFINIEDYTENTASPIRAVTVSEDGLAFVSRSATSLFFFNNPLRMLGSYEAADIAGGAGVAIHPVARIGTAALGNLYGDWVAAGSAAPEIVLIETRHFRRVGTIPLREPVGGPLRVIQRQDGDPADVIAHIFGVTRSGAVFHVPVRTTYFTP